MPSATTLRSALLALACSILLMARASAENPHWVSVPAGDLIEALESLSKQLRIELAYNVDQLEHAHTAGVSGNLTAEEAIRKLLTGTGLTLLTDPTGAMFIKPVQAVAPPAQTSGRAEANVHEPKSDVSAGLAPFEEVIVTAQKRDESAHDVPIAISVVSAEVMKSLELRDGEDIANYTPGLTWVGTVKPTMILRGASSADFQTGSSSPIALYIDGVYVGSNFGVNNLLMDLERVEVLKGPQGTLWGRNATAGVLSFVPKKAKVGAPLTGDAAITYGSYEELDTQLAVGFPITDRVAGRVAAEYYSQGGMFEASGPFKDEDYGSKRWNAVRANIESQPSEQLSVGATFNYSKMNSGRRPLKALGTLGTGCSNPGELGTTCGDYQGYVSPQDPFETQPFAPSFDRTEAVGANVQATYAFRAATLTSITALLKDRRRSYEDTGSLTALGENSYDDEYEARSQELRIASTSDGALSWIAGLYYYEDDLSYYRGANNTELLGSATYFAQSTETETGAVFGELTYNLTERLKVTAGARYTYDERRAPEVTAGLFAATRGTYYSRQAALDGTTSRRFTLTDVSAKFTEPTGRLSIAYSATEDLNIWVTAARGFKGGDPNSGAQFAEQFRIVEPEFLNSLETGIKYRSHQAGLQLALSAYYYDYTDKQVFTITRTAANPSLLTLTNAAAMEIHGLDVEASWAPTDRFSARWGSAYTHARYDEYVDRGGRDLAGNLPALSPDWAHNATIRYDWPVPNNAGTIGIQADAVYRGDYFFTDTNEPGPLHEQAYWLVGSSIGYAPIDRRWDARIWVKNLTDERYRLSAIDYRFFGPVVALVGDRRSYGASLTFHF